MTADEDNYISGSAVAGALQTMIDGAEQNFMIRRSDTGPETIMITGRMEIEFDLNVPPN